MYIYIFLSIYLAIDLATHVPLRFSLICFRAPPKKIVLVGFPFSGASSIGEICRPATFVSPDVGATNALLAAVAMAALPGQQGLELHGGGDVELASGHEIQGIQGVVVER